MVNWIVMAAMIASVFDTKVISLSLLLWLSRVAIATVSSRIVDRCSSNTRYSNNPLYYSEGHCHLRCSFAVVGLINQVKVDAGCLSATLSIQREDVKGVYKSIR